MSENFESIEQRTKMNMQKSVQSNVVNWDSVKFTYIEIPITTHCNLNCFRCNHYAPLAKPWNIDLETFETYMIELKRISDNWPITNMHDKFSVCLLGGEPLLHPNLLELCKMARQYLPENYIYICTNGILLSKFDQIFYDTLNEYKIGVQFSNYKNIPSYNDPELLNIVNNIANQFEWPYRPIMLVKNHEGFVNSNINFVDTHSGYRTYTSCMRDNINIGIRNGKIYKCPQAGFIDVLFDYFHIDPKLNYDQLEDTIDLCDSYYDDIVAFLKKPGKICKYCQFFCNGAPVLWQQSKKDISEWIQDYNKGE